MRSHPNGLIDYQYPGDCILYILTIHLFLLLRPVTDQL
jgi:hypothetical protein